MAGLQKNVAGQKWRVFAFNITTGAAVTGDAANITAKIAIDWGTATATNDVNPTEVEDGYYVFDLTQAETNGNVLDIYPESTTSNVQVIGVPGTIFTTISATAKANLTLQYDGTGLTGDTYPATQAQVGKIAVAGAAINTVAESYVLTTGVQSSGTYTDTQTLDGTEHQHTDSAGALELYYQFDVGNDGIPTSVKTIGRLAGSNDSVGVYAYNWAGTTWNQIGTLTGTNGSANETDTYDLLSAHVGTGSNVGKVRIRYYAASGLTSATLYVDQILVSYAQASAGIANGSSITLGASTTNTNLIGRSWSLALGGQNIAGSFIFQAVSVTGTATGTNGSPFIFQECSIGTASLAAYGFLENCALTATLTLTSTGDVATDAISLINCSSAVPGSGSPSIDASGVTKATQINVRRWSGGMSVTLNSSCTMSIDAISGGTITVNGTGGSINIRGILENVIDNSGGTVSITQTAVINDNDLKFIADIVESQRGSHTWHGNVWYVDPANGNDTTGDGSRSLPYATVTKAHTSATDYNHDIIFVVAGNSTGTTLTEQVTISKNYLFIRGPGRDFLWNYNDNGDVITITGEGVELSGFRLQTHTVGSGDAINVSGDFCKLHNLWIEYARQYGIYINNSDWCQIHDNTISNCGKDAESAGVYIFQNGGGTAANNRIFWNNFEDNTGAAMETNGATSDTVIKDNNIHGSSTYGVIIGTGGLTTGVYGNTFSSNTLGDVSDSGTNTYREKNNICLIQPGQETPPANPTPAEAAIWPYKLLRNKKDNDGSVTQFYNDDGVTVDHKQTTTEAGGTVTKGEIEAGP